MFEWKPEYNVNVEGVDDEHQRLFALAAQLHLAMTQGKGKAAPDLALARLADYTRIHFGDEEQLMREHAYPDTEVHKALHEDLMARILDFQKRLAANQPCLTIELLTFLRNWFQYHISDEDQKYASYVRHKAAV
jgi:hemerythrin-like metal-binding protein